jgi:hypothetical protein
MFGLGRLLVVEWRHDGGGPEVAVPQLIGPIMASIAPEVIVVIRVVLGVLLLAHGLVHLLFLASEPVFSLEHSWLLPASIRTPVAYTLLVATIGAFALLALAVWGVPGLAIVWPVLAMIAAALSTVLLVLFWNWQLGLGIVINAALVVAAFARLGGVAFTST